ncbi:ZIP family metal transporter [Candidatus Curtissbacteria bacterium]|nr:ZIP family metal transporter [Candidatus Curtissbacteria bacterium]
MLPLIILFTFVGSIASLVGSFFLLIRRNLTESFSGGLINFAAGVLLAVAFLDLLPEALEAAGGSDVFIPTLAGFVGFFFAERFIQLFHHHHGHGEKPTTLLVVAGDGVHNFIDGVVITASFLTSVPLGITTSLAVAAHEIPQEIADMGVLLANGLSKKKALLLNFLSALTALIGAILAFYFSEFVEANLYIFLSITAGFFIYISASDLIPQIHEKYLQNKKFNQISLFVLGIIAVFLFTGFFEL